MKIEEQCWDCGTIVPRPLQKTKPKYIKGTVLRKNVDVSSALNILLSENFGCADEIKYVRQKGSVTVKFNDE